MCITQHKVQPLLKKSVKTLLDQQRQPGRLEFSRPPGVPIYPAYPKTFTVMALANYLKPQAMNLAMR